VKNDAMTQDAGDKSVNWRAVRNKTQSLRRAAEEIVRQLDQIIADPPDDAFKGVGLVAEELDVWRGLATRLPERLNDALVALKSVADQQVATIEPRLARDLKSKGHSIFGETAILIVDGIVYVDTSKLSEGKVSVNMKAVDELTVAAIAKRVDEELVRLHKLAISPRRFLEGLWAAYQQELQEAGKQLGSQVETVALLFRMALQRQTAAFKADPTVQKFREYSHECFRADLYSLLASGESVIKGHRLRYASGANTHGAVFLLVPALQRPAHVGRLWFDGTEVPS
jgi:hypothetical protein